MSVRRLPSEPRFWTPQRVVRLACLIGDGRSDAEIGRRLGTTAAAVSRARLRYGIAPRLKQGHLHTAKGVAHLLGVMRAQVTRWLEAGWLKGSRGQARGPHRQWVVTHSHLLSFLEDPRHWHLWDAARVHPASGFRAWAIALRSQGERLLTTTEVAERCYVARQTVTGWLRTGRLQGVRNGVWFVPESALESFTPPCERSRPFIPRRLWTDEEDAQLRALREAGLTYAAISRELGRSVNGVSNRWLLITGRRRP